jgi:hypothetical protein
LNCLTCSSIDGCHGPREEPCPQGTSCYLVTDVHNRGTVQMPSKLYISLQ